MRITRRQLRRIIKESLLEAGMHLTGKGWKDPESGEPDSIWPRPGQAFDYNDAEYSGEMAQADYAAGMLDAKSGRAMLKDPNDDYAAGYEDGVAQAEYNRAEKKYIEEATGDQLPYRAGQPWQDPDLQVRRKPDDVDYLDRELTDEEMDDAGYYEEDGYPFTVGYTHSKTGEQMEHIINNDGESEDFFRMFFNTHGRAHPYSVN